MKVFLDVTPVAKPRMSQRDKWASRPCVMRYRKFCDEIRLAAKSAGFELPDAHWRAIFYLPMPKSWPKKKRAVMHRKPHQKKPDTSNLIKALEDALRKDDEQIWDLAGRKFWSEKGYIVIDSIQDNVS